MGDVCHKVVLGRQSVDMVRDVVKSNDSTAGRAIRTANAPCSGGQDPRLRTSSGPDLVIGEVLTQHGPTNGTGRSVQRGLIGAEQQQLLLFRVDNVRRAGQPLLGLLAGVGQDVIAFRIHGHHANSHRVQDGFQQPFPALAFHQGCLQQFILGFQAGPVAVHAAVQHHHGSCKAQHHEREQHFPQQRGGCGPTGLEHWSPYYEQAGHGAEDHGRLGRVTGNAEPKDGKERQHSRRGEQVLAAVAKQVNQHEVQIRNAQTPGRGQLVPRNHNAGREQDPVQHQACSQQGVVHQGWMEHGNQHRGHGDRQKQRQLGQNDPRPRGTLVKVPVNKLVHKGIAQDHFHQSTVLPKPPPLKALRTVRL